jgi:hypothetical protein
MSEKPRTAPHATRTLQAQNNCLDIGDELGNCTATL